MNFGFKCGYKKGQEPDLMLDPILEETLRDLRQSVHAWSEDAMARPRTVAAVQRSLWRLAAGWALGLAIAAGAVSGGYYSHYQRRQAVTHLAAEQEAERQRLAAEQRAYEEENLLAMVDSVVSRQAPRAMEPLARLMDESLEEDSQ